jgi:hypothetical protein
MTSAVCPRQWKRMNLALDLRQSLKSTLARAYPVQNGLRKPSKHEAHVNNI